MLAPLKGSLGGALHYPWPEAAWASSVLLYVLWGEAGPGCSVGLLSEGAEQEGSVGSDSDQCPPKVLVRWLWLV